MFFMENKEARTILDFLKKCRVGRISSRLNARYDNVNVLLQTEAGAASRY
jgi:hypothetical protein